MASQMFQPCFVLMENIEIPDALAAAPNAAHRAVACVRAPRRSACYARRMLLNVDAGEIPGEPEALAALAHVLHVACGGHAGDEGTMRETVRRAARFGARVGAHPSYPDREGFGRRAMEIPYERLAVSLRDQLASLARVAAAEGVSLVSLKPHGALYHAADRDPSLAALVSDLAAGAYASPLALVGSPGGYLQSASLSRGLVFHAEGFADRAYEEDGTLRDRAKVGALLSDPVAAVAQARALAATGRYGTICVHGDSPNAVALLRALREVFP
jgi:UPF0271 protein